jgi:hypothetical protein
MLRRRPQRIRSGVEAAGIEPAQDSSQSALASRPLPAHALNDLDQLVRGVAVAARELHELPRTDNDGAAVWARSNGDPATAAKVDDSLIAQCPQSSKDRVRVDAENSGQIPRWR